MKQYNAVQKNLCKTIEIRNRSLPQIVISLLLLIIYIRNTTCLNANKVSTREA
jgi:hypothetical protein